jgi:sugar/nucleoside kinase (ribokinase family)
LKSSIKDILNTPLLRASAFHFFATPDEIETHVPELLRLRHTKGIREHPLIVWEPMPAACELSNLRAIRDACQLVDVFSPNHLELLGIFGKSAGQDFNAEEFESLGVKLVQSSIGAAGKGTLIVRAGENGSLTISRETRPTWFPPFYQSQSPRVVDPTGAGNTFLGGYIAGWHATQSEVEATWYGHVAASFALEQIGLPKLKNEGDKESWNGADVMIRLDEYKSRLREGPVKSESVV